MKFLSFAFLCLLNSPICSQTWTTTPRTDDASSGIGPQRIHAARFVRPKDVLVNGVNITDWWGLEVPDGNLAGLMQPSEGDENALTIAGVGGSAEVASDFFYDADPGMVTFSKLAPGRRCVATFLSVGWDGGAAPHWVEFVYGASTTSVNQNAYGQDPGIRVERVSTASGTTHGTTIPPLMPGMNWHVYAAPVRDPLRVVNSNNSGPGTLRQYAELKAPLAPPGEGAAGLHGSGQLLTSTHPVIQ
jgi:hypothetical protein